VLPVEAARALVPISDLSFSSSATGRLPLALSEVLGISISEVMERYFGGADSPDELVSRVVRETDRMGLEDEGKAWLAREQRRIAEELEREHRGEGVDDAF
jgi:hypothetical protein